MLLRVQHRSFVAKWARAAKGRFHFATMCEDNAVNRAALHRWFLAQWRENGMNLVQVDQYMLEAIEMALEPTDTYHQVMTKRQMKRFARMEYYNERRALQIMK
jgi:hypothetical protein